MTLITGLNETIGVVLEYLQDAKVINILVSKVTVAIMNSQS